MWGDILGPDPSAAGRHFGKVYHRLSSPSNNNSFIMNFLAAHARMCEPAEEHSDQTHSLRACGES